MKNEGDHTDSTPMHLLRGDVLMATNVIRIYCPSLYEHLLETPMDHDYDSAEIGIQEMEEYIESMSEQLGTVGIDSN
jgi:hypothetical protein